jgi:UDP-N-acetylglucosamine 2-epimerase
MHQAKYKVISIVGARPQFIKLAALHHAVRLEQSIHHIIVHSGQHYDEGLSGNFFKELNIPAPDYNLGIGSATHNMQIASCISALDPLLEQENPDMVIVFGDTNTTAAGAIAAAKRNIPLSHIEAGLREFDKTIPEEVNKLLTDAVTDLFFVPTAAGIQNLHAAGINENVFLTGDITLDLLNNLPESNDTCRKLDIAMGQYIFMTCHRDANTSSAQNLEEIFLGAAGCGLPVVFTVHPRTIKAVQQFRLQGLLQKEPFIILEPQGFYDTQHLIKNAAAVITDSGGVIKEAYFHKVHGIITDKQTEWVETVDEGWNSLAGPDKLKITEAFNNWKIPIRHSNCIGDGKAGARIVTEISHFLHARKQKDTHTRATHG